MERGFTLIEFLLVVSIMGIMLSVILPRALRAGHEAKFSQIRQDASEIGSYVTQWGQRQTEAQSHRGNYTVRDFFLAELDADRLGYVSTPLIHKYTGNEAFKGVGETIPATTTPRNPFNEVSYFKAENDDQVVPSKKPGLLYFVSVLDGEEEAAHRLFYFIITGDDGKWFGDMDKSDPSGIRRGVFVGRYSETNMPEITEKGGLDAYKKK